MSGQSRGTSVGSEERSFNSAYRRKRDTSHHAFRRVRWPGQRHLTQSSERTGIENKWFALTGRVVALKVEMDGDLHIALQMRPEKKRALLCVKYRRSSNGVRSAKRFSVGRQRDSLFTLVPKKTKIARSADHHSNWKGVLGRRPCA